ncbi:MAG: hypothetical protein K1X79_13780 [Oligoflexia bacterium]|nr:hypothetical protein [Oligoflexia bacterium]
MAALQPRDSVDPTDGNGNPAVLTTDAALRNLEAGPDERGATAKSGFSRSEPVHYGAMLETLRKPLTPFYPVHRDLLAPQLLAGLGFKPETKALGEAYESFVAANCKPALGVIGALATLGLEKAEANMTLSTADDGTVMVRVVSADQVIQFNFRPDAKNPKKLNVDQASVIASDDVQGKLVDASGRLTRDFRILEGLAREFMDYPARAKQSLQALAEKQIQAAIDGELFWSKVTRGEAGVEDALLAHVLDTKIGTYAGREHYGALKDGGSCLGPVREELAQIRRELEALVRPTAITDQALAKEVAERLMLFREGAYSFPHQVSVPHGSFIGAMRWERERGLFDPIVAIPTDPDNAKRPIDVLLKERVSGTGPDAWKPALREFLQAKRGEGTAERAERVLRFAVDCLFPFVDQTPGHFITGAELVTRYLEPLMVEGQGRTWAYYYGFFKTHSTLRTGSSSAAVGPAEYEMLRALAGIALAAKERLDVPLRFTIVDEASAVAELAGVHNLGVTRAQVITNHAMARKFLELIGAGDVVEVRHFPEDLRTALGRAEFERQKATLTANQAAKENLPLHRLFILASAVPVEHLRDMGLSRDDILAFYTRHLQGGKGPGGEFTRADIPPAVRTAIEETAFQFDALMRMREAAKKAATGLSSPPPQFLPDAVSLGVTHAATRLSICPTPRFQGTATLPLHGLPVYGGGEYLGNVQLWRVAANPDLFTVYVDPERNPLFVGFRLPHRAVELFKAKQAQ